ncbi:uncharacterized protein CcaverHIS019_0112690 [Cutaneotrichosporon cavernicola]|uniref:NEDD8-activating enzyme E1 regulatory subunit n=1 Tax=Cutaneotrichosporon cavernicola TaxID=279322 RepID=A0AA48KZE8_9TREE|nr:uncharacterized protein CcaverHIS019_0112690 [Cutaneotrichosporon cavernicola]BEI88551.1 hypothetical protein CcaverHIS019_0112690 [Cutaneotrichosporon cavernicola]BEI96324.1 hypothetical protein CcaverHIS631_0112730 [Cutaneotrichosporon cavernicola]
MATRGRDPPSSPSAPSRPPKIAKMDDAVDISEATTAIAVGSGTSSRNTPVPPGRPDAKARRYDRQLRLWASAGQRSLESARILLVGHDAVGCQAIKNLVLPGIQHFTILSDATTAATDVASNFFLEPTSIGHPIAKEEVRFLCELNPAVTGEARVADPVALLDTDPAFFLSYTLIITSNIPPALEDRIADLLWQTSSTPEKPDIPLMSIRTSGLTGRLQIQVREHCVVDTHPDTTHTLRIDAPFPALEEYARGLDLESMEVHVHSHIPWVVLLVRATSQWKESHNGNLPTSKEDKEAFKKLLNSWRMKYDEENFDEAVGQAYRASVPSELPYDVAELINDPAVVSISMSSKNLHILLHTLRRFMDTPPKLPPVAPSLPDMHSSTESYVNVQQLYKQAFQEDLAMFSSLLGGVLREIGLHDDAVPEAEVESFVKNVGGVAIVKGTSLLAAKEYQGGMKERIEEDFPFGEGEELMPSYGSEISIVLAILASEHFYKAFGHWPGAKDSDMALDVAEVERFARKALVTVHADTGEELPTKLTNAIGEVVRGGFLTPPNTAAFMGGIVGQEAIKLVTNQYQPLDNTVAVDLVKSGIEKFKL